MNKDKDIKLLEDRVRELEACVMELYTDVGHWLTPPSFDSQQAEQHAKKSADCEHPCPKCGVWPKNGKYSCGYKPSPSSEPVNNANADLLFCSAGKVGGNINTPSSETVNECKYRLDYYAKGTDPNCKFHSKTPSREPVKECNCECSEKQTSLVPLDYEKAIEFSSIDHTLSYREKCIIKQICQKFGQPRVFSIPNLNEIIEDYIRGLKSGIEYMKKESINYDKSEEMLNKAQKVHEVLNVKERL